VQDDKRKAFRSALGNFATGVTIVTTRDAEGRPVGLTASSFNSVSLDPPMVLWSLALESPNMAAFRQSTGWAVHVLSADQEDMTNRFATRGADKFAGLEIADGPEGAPMIPGCAARFGCRATFEYDGGDHAIFVGEVIDFQHHDRAPLIFHGGSYGRVMTNKLEQRPAEFENDGEFGRYFVGHMLSRAHHAAFAELRREYRKRGLRSSEYTVVVSLGLGEGCTRAELLQRAANGGVDLPLEAIDQLIERGLIVTEGECLNLTATGRTRLTELMAVAQSTQLHFENSLTMAEMTQLHDLLRRLSETAPQGA
jgi:3-hydroxy-9,10-secoandrosta-1,3,5(10)-triene-9,17-dione monooxygenase reductase component